MRFCGTFIDTPSLGELAIYQDYLLEVNAEGFISRFGPFSHNEGLSRDAKDFTQIPAGCFLLPTFTDLHLHAPQFLYQGTGLDLTLFEWLDKYTYKSEERLDCDTELAERVYRRLARRLVENGTGAVSLFGTIKEDTNIVLAKAMQEAGVKARVGKLSMDISTRPTYVEASADASLTAAETFVDRCLLLNVQSRTINRSNKQATEGLIQPVLTPRFVPTCSDTLLRGLGELSRERSLPIQSHLAEGQEQVDWVKSTRGRDDIDVFNESNLLTPRTLQAHCTFLTPPDLTRVSAYGVSIAHCPLSNVYFSTKPFPLREALDQKVKVGLGTDVAGGYSLDVMNAMRNAVLVSRIRENERLLKRRGSNAAVSQLGDANHDEDIESLAINWKESLYLATRGGAAALDFSPGSGIFRVGAPFDAQQIQLFDENLVGTGPLDFFDIGRDNPATLSLSAIEEMVEKWWCIGDNRNRTGMWVQGRKLFM